MNKSYRDSIKALLSPAERRVFEKLYTPSRIQDYLEALPQNFSRSGVGTCRSPRRILKARSAYCFEGALLGAALLAYHGREPLLLDLRTSDDDYDHVVALFKEKTGWGAVSKTNNPVLRYRDPVYKSVRELAMSYFHEYFLPNGKKSLLAYSRPFNVSRYKAKQWVVAKESLDWLAEKLDDLPHYPIAPKAALRSLRRATPLERKLLRMEEWESKKKN